MTPGDNTGRMSSIFVSIPPVKNGLGIQFDDVSVAQHIGMVALCIILFTGGMDTKIMFQVDLLRTKDVEDGGGVGGRHRGGQ